MRKLNLLLFLFLNFQINTFAFANEIVEVKRNITLANDETPLKDFYIKSSNTGAFKKGLVVKAVRKVNVKDSSQKVVGDFKTTVGLLKVIKVSDTIVVAREFKLIPRTEEPVLEQIGIMTGDEIDLDESFLDTAQNK